MESAEKSEASAENNADPGNSGVNCADTARKGLLRRGSADGPVQAPE